MAQEVIIGIACIAVGVMNTLIAVRDRRMGIEPDRWNIFFAVAGFVVGVGLLVAVC